MQGRGSRGEVPGGLPAIEGLRQRKRGNGNMSLRTPNFPIVLSCFGDKLAIQFSAFPIVR